MYCTGEAALVVAGFGAEHAVDALEAARREAVVVLLVAGSGPREHDVIAVLSAGSAIPIVLRIVLRIIQMETSFIFCKDP